MTSVANARTAEVRSAREARAILAEASARLQGAPSDGELEKAIEFLAQASSTLYELETDSPASEDYRSIRAAIAHLSHALGVLQGLPPGPAVDAAVEALARTLALLYPVARTHQRRRRRVILDIFGDPDSMPALAPPAPEPTGAPPERDDFAGRNQRAGGDRVFVEVDIGLASQSHFYTGLSRDLSRGGLFVATYKPQPPGTQVTVNFVLPDGRAVKARGVVRWTVDARDDMAPGMGVAFEQVDAEDLNAIEDFCGARSPIYHQSGDE